MPRPETGRTERIAQPWWGPLEALAVVAIGASMFVVASVLRIACGSLRLW
jgi:hypothetical protein